MLILVIIVIAFAVLFQAIKPEAALKKIAGWLLLAVFALAAVSALQAMWQGMTIWQRLIVFLLGVLGGFALIRKLF